MIMQRPKWEGENYWNLIIFFFLNPSYKFLVWLKYERVKSNRHLYLIEFHCKLIKNFNPTLWFLHGLHNLLLLKKQLPRIIFLSSLNTNGRLSSKLLCCFRQPQQPQSYVVCWNNFQQFIIYYEIILFKSKCCHQQNRLYLTKTIKQG